MVQLSITKFHQADHKRVTYVAYPAEGTTFEDVLRPEYWAHISNRLRVTDIIEVIPEDMSYYARLIVLLPGRTFAKVALLEKINLSGVDAGAAVDDGYEVKLRGPRKWSIIRKSDKAIIAEDIDREVDARAKLAEHLKVMAA